VKPVKIRIALLQKRSEPWNIARNLWSLECEMEEAARMGADILLIPECYMTGYELPAKNEDVLPTSGEWLDVVCSMAKRNRIGVVVTALTQGSESPRNSAILINKQGKILMQYDKVHTCDFADEFCLESGEEFKVADFHGIKIGIMICYDREYPESARVLMMKGAELILVPNDCESMRPRVAALSTRAYENMVGVAMANPPGDNAGCSCAYSPICWDEEGKCVDNTLLLAGEEEGMFLVEFDMDAIRDYRANEMMGNTFRKVGAYHMLFSETIEPPFLREGQNKKGSKYEKDWLR